MSSIGHNGGPVLDQDGKGPGKWIAVARSLREHGVVGFGSEGRYSRSEAWLDLLMLAEYRPTEVKSRGRVVQLKPGQLLGARSFLAERWNWTQKQVRLFLTQLEDEGMIRRDTPEPPSVIAQSDDRSVRVEATIDGLTSVDGRGPPNGADCGQQNGQHEGQQRGQQKGHQSGNVANVITMSNYVYYQRLEAAISDFIENKRELTRATKVASNGASNGASMTATNGSEKGPQSNNSKNNNTTTTTDVESVAVRAPRTARDVVVDSVVNWFPSVHGDRVYAEQWVANQIGFVGADVLTEAVRITQSKIDSGEKIAKPLQFVSSLVHKLQKQGFGSGSVETQKKSGKITAALGEYTAETLAPFMNGGSHV